MQQGRVEIITPEGVSLQFETAGIGSRFMAYAVDFCIQILAFLVIFLLTYLYNNASFVTFWDMLDSGLIAIGILASFLLFYGYFIFFELILGGQTPGKKAMRLRVLQANGAPAGTTAIIIRNLLRIIDSLPGMYLLGIFAIFLSPQEQRLGDLAAGTMVVKESRAKAFILSKPSYKIEYLPDGFKLTSQEIQALHGYFTREKEIMRDRQAELRNGYVVYFKNKYGVCPDTIGQARDFLLALLQSAESPMEPEPEAEFPNPKRFS